MGAGVAGHAAWASSRVMPGVAGVAGVGCWVLVGVGVRVSGVRCRASGVGVAASEIRSDQIRSDQIRSTLALRYNGVHK